MNIPSLLLCLLFACAGLPSSAQLPFVPDTMNLVLDRYSAQRTKIPPGSEIIFRLHTSPHRISDYIGSMNPHDSTVYLVQAGVHVPLRDFKTFYFRRNFPDAMAPKLSFVGSGFLFAAAVAPLMGDNISYSRSESAIIGASGLALAQSMRLFRWKKFHVNKRSRIRILDTRL